MKRLKFRVLLGDEMGLGKSHQALMPLAEDKTLRPVVIICPATLKKNWQNEVSKHLGMHAEILEGTTPKKRIFPTTQIYIVNYEILGPRGAAHSWVGFFRKLKPKYVIIDEGHRLGNMKTLQYRNVAKLVKKDKAKSSTWKGVPHIAILTGTPIGNNLIELFPIINIIVPKKFPSFKRFAFRYTRPRRAPWGMVYKGMRRVKELNRKLKEFMIRRLKKDVLSQLPALSHTVIPLPIIKRRQYDMAENDFDKWITTYHPKKAKRALAAKDLTKVGYLKRLAAKLKMKAALEWFDDFLKNTTGKILIFTWHKKIIQRLFKRYKKIAVKIDGDTPHKKRQEYEEKFMRDPKCRLCFGQIKVMGVGLNLTAAEWAIFFEMGWKPTDQSQAVARAHRLGQHNAVGAYYLVAEDTTEEDLVKLHQTKQNIADAVVDGGKGSEVDLFELLVQKIQRRVRKRKKK